MFSKSRKEKFMLKVILFFVGGFSILHFLTAAAIADDIVQSFSSCWMEAAKIYPRGAAMVRENSTHNYSHDEELEQTGQMAFMNNCMIKYGYKISIKSDQCKGGYFGGFENQIACWVTNKN